MFGYKGKGQGLSAGSPLKPLYGAINRSLKSLEN